LLPSCHFAILVVAALALTSAFAVAQAPADDPPQANPARPTVATPATLTPVGYLQFESGVQVARHSAEFASRVGFNEVVKLAVQRRFQLVAQAEPFARWRDAGGVANGTGDVLLGFQAVLYPGEGARPTLAASYLGHARAGDTSEIDFGTPEHSVILLASADVKGFHYDANAMFNSVEVPSGGQRAQFGQTISVAHPLGRGFGLGAELWHFTQPATRGHCAGSLWALNYNARRNLVFDVGFNRGLTSTSTRWEVFAGVTYLLPYRLWRR
jgi:hypothetical protein